MAAESSTRRPSNPPAGGTSSRWRNPQPDRSVRSHPRKWKSRPDESSGRDREPTGRVVRSGSRYVRTEGVRTEGRTYQKRRKRHHHHRARTRGDTFGGDARPGCRRHRSGQPPARTRNGDRRLRRRTKAADGKLPQAARSRGRCNWMKNRRQGPAQVEVRAGEPTPRRPGDEPLARAGNPPHQGRDRALKTAARRAAA